MNKTEEELEKQETTIEDLKKALFEFQELFDKWSQLELFEERSSILRKISDLISIEICRQCKLDVCVLPEEDHTGCKLVIE